MEMQVKNKNIKSPARSRKKTAKKQQPDKQAELLVKRHMKAMEISAEGMAIINGSGKLIYLNRSLARLHGYKKPDELIGKSLTILYGKGGIKGLTKRIQDKLMEEGAWNGEVSGKRKDRTVFYHDLSITRLEDGSSVLFARDIAEKKAAELALQKSEAFLNTIFDSIHDPFCIFNNDFKIVRVNDAYASLKKKSVDDLLGKTCHSVMHRKKTPCKGCIVDVSFKSSHPCVKEKFIKMPDGTKGWVEIYTYPILCEDGRISHVIEYTRNVTERKKADNEKRQLIRKLGILSSIDSLTGVLNRRALLERLEYEMGRAERYRHPLSLLLCDIDYFKEINDTYGHAMGDKVLKKISDTLLVSIRKTDIVGRYGGDEFMLIFPETHVADAEKLAGKIRRLAQKINITVRKKTIALTLSCGISSFRHPSENMDTFIKRADDALYTSKRYGRNRVSTQ